MLVQYTLDHLENVELENVKLDFLILDNSLRTTNNKLFNEENYKKEEPNYKTKITLFSCLAWYFFSFVSIILQLKGSPLRFIEYLK